MGLVLSEQYFYAQIYSEIYITHNPYLVFYTIPILPNLNLKNYSFINFTCVPARLLQVGRAHYHTARGCAHYFSCTHTERANSSTKNRAPNWWNHSCR